jgi:hypothetical protein
MRNYNPKKDRYYSPDDTPNLYLTDEQINHALKSIPNFDGREEEEVRRVIIKLETLNRDEKLGQITPDDSFKRSRKLADEFLKQFGFWPYITKTHQAFYEFFIKK